MVYSITEVVKSDKINNIYSVTISDGTREVTIRMNKKEIMSSDGRKKVKSRVLDKFKENVDIENEENIFKKTIKEVLSI